MRDEATRTVSIVPSLPAPPIFPLPSLESWSECGRRAISFFLMHTSSSSSSSSSSSRVKSFLFLRILILFFHYFFRHVFIFLSLVLSFISVWDGTRPPAVRPMASHVDRTPAAGPLFSIGRVPGSTSCSAS